LPPLGIAPTSHLLKLWWGLFKRIIMATYIKFYSDARKSHLYIFQAKEVYNGEKKFTHISPSLTDCLEKKREWKTALEKEYTKKKYLTYGTK